MKLLIIKIKYIWLLIRNRWARGIFHIVNAYFWLLRKIIPCKVVTINLIEPLTGKRKIKATFLTRNDCFDFDLLLDKVFESVAKDMRLYKNITPGFVGLAFKTPKGKYELYKRGSGYSAENDPDRKI